MSKPKKFKDRGKEILDPPTNMQDFLDDQDNPPQDVKQPKTTNQQSSEETRISDSQADNDLDRLHIQIRKDLKIKLKRAVFERSLEKSRKNGASERAVTEEALENFLQDI